MPWLRWWLLFSSPCMACACHPAQPLQHPAAVYAPSAPSLSPVAAPAELPGGGAESAGLPHRQPHLAAAGAPGSGLQGFATVGVGYTVHVWACCWPPSCLQAAAGAALPAQLPDARWCAPWGGKVLVGVLQPPPLPLLCVHPTPLPPLQLDHIYSADYFLLLLALLGASLAACTATNQWPAVKVARRWRFKADETSLARLQVGAVAGPATACECGSWNALLPKCGREAVGRWRGVAAAPMDYQHARVDAAQLPAHWPGLNPRHTWSAGVLAAAQCAGGRPWAGAGGQAVPGGEGREEESCAWLGTRPGWALCEGKSGSMPTPFRSSRCCCPALLPRACFL